jgi:hypothetical protein
MRLLPLVVLIAALAACGRKPPAAPTPEALGTELATYPQILVPLTPQTLEDLRDVIARKGIENVSLSTFKQSYAHGSATVNGKHIAVFVAFAGTWQAPKGVPLQPMSVQQYLRAFAGDVETDVATLAAPKGNMFFTREQLPDVIGAARAAGASSGDLPFVVVAGSGR